MRKALFILGELNDTDVEWMINYGRRKRLPVGSVLIREGGSTDALFILLDGTVAISIKTVGNGAGERVLYQRSTGEIMGEVSFVDARPPTATVKAQDEVLVLAIPREILQAKLLVDAGFASRFYRAVALTLSYRLREVMDQLAAGQDTAGNKASVSDEDELDLEVMDKVYLAGQRFERILKRLSGEGA